LLHIFVVGRCFVTKAVKQTNTLNMKFIALYRVSTQKQGRSGLSLADQREVVQNHIHSKSRHMMEVVGIHKEKLRMLDSDSPIGKEYLSMTKESHHMAELVGEYEEKISTRKKKRPVLEAALRACEENKWVDFQGKEHKAILIVAKLDRLGRDVEFLFSLRNRGVNFHACDLPALDGGDIGTNTLMLGLMASFAEYERERIGKRTAAALAQKKKRFQEQMIKEGKHEITDWRKPYFKKGDGNAEKGGEAMRQAALDNDRNKQARYVAFEEKKKGRTLREIADELNSRGFRTAREKLHFHANTVRRLIIAEAEFRRAAAI